MVATPQQLERSTHVSSVCVMPERRTHGRGKDVQNEKAGLESCLRNAKTFAGRLIFVSNDMRQLRGRVLSVECQKLYASAARVGSSANACDDIRGR